MPQAGYQRAQIKMQCCGLQSFVPCLVAKKGLFHHHQLARQAVGMMIVCFCPNIVYGFLQSNFMHPALISNHALQNQSGEEIITLKKGTNFKLH